MKWYKHDSDANMDSKLQEILLDYGLEGYGLYWYCLEMIVNKIEVDNLTFELEHDARIIARNTGSTPQKVTEMMTRFVDLGLFENTEGRITCLKLLQRLDKSMTSNPKFREAIAKAKMSHDTVMINPDLVMQDKKRLEEIRLEERDINPDAWSDYVQHRREIKKTITPLSETKQKNVLRQFDFESQQKIVDTTVANGWTGLFPERLKQGGRKLTYAEQLAEDINATNK